MDNPTSEILTPQRGYGKIAKHEPTSTRKNTTRNKGSNRSQKVTPTTVNKPTKAKTRDKKVAYLKGSQIYLDLLPER